MSNKKQTAVEWLKDQLECFGNKHELTISWTTVDELVEQAKEMGKQQIIDAWIATDNELQRIAAEEYYKKTFNNE